MTFRVRQNGFCVLSEFYTMNLALGKIPATPKPPPIELFLIFLEFSGTNWLIRLTGVLTRPILALHNLQLIFTCRRMNTFKFLCMVDKVTIIDHVILSY